MILKVKEIRSDFLQLLQTDSSHSQSFDDLVRDDLEWARSCFFQRS